MDTKEYMRIHDYIRKHKKGNVCEICNSNNKKLDNALIVGMTHEKNIHNYIKLCKKCHYHYDHPNGIKHSNEAKIKIGIASSERIKKNGVNVNFINSGKNRIISNETRKRMSESHKKEMTHGTLTSYHKYKCRCDICKLNYSNYQKNYRKNGK